MQPSIGRLGIYEELLVCRIAVMPGADWAETGGGKIIEKGCCWWPVMMWVNKRPGQGVGWALLLLLLLLLTCR